MKPVLRTVIDKNGAEETVFSPTPQMILYSIFRADNPGITDPEVCRMAGINPDIVGKWKSKYGSYFTNWIEEAIDAGTSDDAKVLERVGMIEAVQGNYQYWRDMARQKGVIRDEKTEIKININTDFSSILQAAGDLNEARKRILLKARGVVVEGGSGVAPGAGEQRQSPGNRAGNLLERPVEMADALGANRGRSEQRTPVPAIPKQDTPAMSYRVLDERTLPPDPEE